MTELKCDSKHKYIVSVICAEWNHIPSVVMLSVVMLGVVMLGFVMLGVVMLGVVMLGV
jgi:hypothetical protein